MKDYNQWIPFQGVRSTSEVKMNHSAVRFSLASLLALGLCSCDSEKALTPTQNAVHGAVVDQNGKPISGAVVAARRAQVQAVTDDNGEYALPKVESLDGPDTLDMTDNKLIRVAMPITWKVKRFEDAVVVKRKVTGSVAGDLGGLSKARIHWRTRGAVEGIPQVVDLANGSYQGEIATLFSKDSLEVQIFLLDTARRVVGKSRLLQINPRSGNIVVPAFPKLNTFEPLSPVYGCGQMGSWDTCAVLLTEPEDSATRMWFREGGEVWMEFQGTFVIPPRLRRIAPWIAERLHTEIEILRKDSAGVERLDTIRVPWKKNPPIVRIQEGSDTVSSNRANRPLHVVTTNVPVKILTSIVPRSSFDILKGRLEYGYITESYSQQYCGSITCPAIKDSSWVVKGARYVANTDTFEITFPSSGTWWAILRAYSSSGDSAADTIYFSSHVSFPIIEPIKTVQWNSGVLEIEFSKPLPIGSSVGLQLMNGEYLVANRQPDQSVGRVQFLTIDSLHPGDSAFVFVFDGSREPDVADWNRPDEFSFEDSAWIKLGRLQTAWIPKSEANESLERRLRSSIEPIVIAGYDDRNPAIGIRFESRKNGFELKYNESESLGSSGIGVFFWNDDSQGACPKRVRFRAKGSDSTRLAVMTNHGSTSNFWDPYDYRSNFVSQVRIGEADSLYQLSPNYLEWGEWSDELNRKWDFWNAYRTPLRQTVIAAFCGNADPANCSKERWLSVSDIEVYSDCTEPLPGTVP